MITPYIATTIIKPCYIAEGVEIIDSKIGPNVSIGANSKIISSEIKNTIIIRFPEKKSSKEGQAHEHKFWIN